MHDRQVSPLGAVFKGLAVLILGYACGLAVNAHASQCYDTPYPWRGFTLSSVTKDGVEGADAPEWPTYFELRAPFGAGGPVEIGSAVRSMEENAVLVEVSP